MPGGSFPSPCCCLRLGRSLLPSARRPVLPRAGSGVGDWSPCPHSPRKLRVDLAFVSVPVVWPGISHPNARSICPLFAGISSSQRLCRALGELAMLLGSKSVSSLMSFGSLGKFAPT